MSGRTFIDIGARSIYCGQRGRTVENRHIAVPTREKMESRGQPKDARTNYDDPRGGGEWGGGESCMTLRRGERHGPAVPSKAQTCKVMTDGDKQSIVPDR